MMDWTDRHDRYFLRLFNPHVRLYTEMVTTGALIHGDALRYLQFDALEHPLALQLGGSDPAALTQCTKMAEDWGYDEVNLNVGCPSDRVQQNKIGACLMAEPELVAECIASMQAAVKIPVTVKHRIGIDNLDDYEHLVKFVDTVAKTGCQTFIVHARIAICGQISQYNLDKPEPGPREAPGSDDLGCHSRPFKVVTLQGRGRVRRRRDRMRRCDASALCRHA